MFYRPWDLPPRRSPRLIGGGDTGADCLGTSHRHGAVSVTQLEILPRPPQTRSDATPWPTWALRYRSNSAIEEGGEQIYAVSTQEFLGDANGSVRALVMRKVDESFQPIDGEEPIEIPCELVLLALGFTGPERGGLLDGLGVELDARGNVKRDADWRTSVDDVYVCGDMGRGQSLIVWAIAEGRACAAAVDRALAGHSLLPAPVVPTDMPLR